MKHDNPENSSSSELATPEAIFAYAASLIKSHKAKIQPAQEDSSCLIKVRVKSGGLEITNLGDLIDE